MADDPAAPSKSDEAFRTIGEVAAETGVPQHVLRYWETRFPQLRPVQRAGKRRYYRPEDVTLVRRIRVALDEQGYTVRGVQQLLAGGAEAGPPPPDAAPDAAARVEAAAAAALAELQAIRALLADALAADDQASVSPTSTLPRVAFE